MDAKLTSNQKIFALILLISLPLIFFFQKKAMYDMKDLHYIKSIYTKMLLKKHRYYKLQFHVDNHEDVFVLDPVIYPAWAKYPFINNVGIRDSITIGIHNEYIPLLNDGKKDFINIAHMAGRDVRKNQLSLLRVKKYNMYRSMSFIKFYVFWGIGVMILLYWKFYWNKANPTIEQKED